MPEVQPWFSHAQLHDGGYLDTPFWMIESGHDGPTLLVMAAQHGNEVQGAEVIRRFFGICATDLRAGMMILIPVVNLPAVRARRPHTGLGPEQPYAEDGGTNIQKLWPGDPRGSDLQRIAFSFYVSALVQCTHAIDIHCWNHFWAPAFFVPNRPEEARAFGAMAHTPFVGYRTTPWPPHNAGVLAEQGAIAMGMELAGQYRIVEEQVRMGLQTVVNVARLLGMLDGEPEPPEYPPTPFSTEDLIEVRAPCAGLFVASDLAPGDRVTEGRKLGHIIRDDNLETVEVRAPACGRLRKFGRHADNCDVSLPDQHPYADRGDMIALIATA